MTRMIPPFRADQVGSLLRPARLLQAREQARSGSLTQGDLRAIEDESIREVVRLQEDVGLTGITDGEHRRTYFHIAFLERLEGVETRGGLPLTFRKQGGQEDFAPPVMHVTAKVKHVEPIQVADFLFLKSVIDSAPALRGGARRTPKVSIPSPTMLHFRGGRAAISQDAYPDLEEFYADVATAYRAELRALGGAGCSYVQVVVTIRAYLCDEALREGGRKRGDDPNELPLRYAKLINAAIAERPAGMTVCVHLCRGNFKSAWAAEGGYEPVAEVLFNELAVDGYFLEYDDARSGDFAPLRFVPKGKQVVLGLVSSKVATLEPVADLARRIDDAARFVALDQLCLSPQCGFSSTVHGNEISVEVQRQKLARVVETAAKVWG
jgi:5-methyltetrahydropteroyltriglutamate--homocysteine methyltransferase